MLMAKLLPGHSPPPGHWLAGQHRSRKMQEKSNSFGALATKASAHRVRCRRLPPMQAGEAERLVAAFLATKSVTPCPIRYAAPVEHRPQLVTRGY